MNYVSIGYYIMAAAVLVLYYMLPLRHRWLALLAGSVCFYYFAAGSMAACICFLAMILLGWGFGFLVERLRSGEKKTWLGWILCACSLIPLAVFKLSGEISVLERVFDRYPWLAPLGISYYSLQLYSYLKDIDQGKISPQKNPLKFILYMSFFPQVVQGPIPRYDELSAQLFDGNRFASKNLVSAMELVTWGFFLKYMIADKADVVVGQIFDAYADMTGAVILLGAVLYSIQLYTDFLACVTIAQGVAIAFGIRLRDNFHHPYFASTVQDFWRRWHMSLSFWLRDYVYIGLGGNRKGKIRKYLNLIITFLISGFWHGGLALNYLFWGLLHAVYQVIGSFTIGARNKLLGTAGIRPESVPVRFFRAFVTSFLVMVAWIIFRAQNLGTGLDMISRMFGNLKLTELQELIPTVLRMGAFMDPKEWYVLFISIAVLLCVSLVQSRLCIRDFVAGLWLPVRWAVYIVPVLIVVIFGSYGHGFNAADFIYGGF